MHTVLRILSPIFLIAWIVFGVGACFLPSGAQYATTRAEAAIALGCYLMCRIEILAHANNLKD